MRRLYKFILFHTPHHLDHESDEGFTLFEVLVVTIIISTLSMIMIFNFRSSASNITARNQTVAAIVADIRGAQSRATNSTIYVDQVGGPHTVCGYGLHYSG